VEESDCLIYSCVCDERIYAAYERICAERTHSCVLNVYVGQVASAVEESLSWPALIL